MVIVSKHELSEHLCVHVSDSNTQIQEASFTMENWPLMSKQHVSLQHNMEIASLVFFGFFSFKMLLSNYVTDNQHSHRQTLKWQIIF